MNRLSVPEEAWRSRYLTRELRVTMNSFHTQFEAVRAGLGVAVLPVELGHAFGLVALPLPDELPAPPPVELYVVTPRALRKVPRVAVVYDALVGALSR